MPLFRDLEKRFFTKKLFIFYYNPSVAEATAPFTQGSVFYLSLSVKSAIISAILICCGQTASQLLQPIQADGRLSSGSDEISSETRKLGPL